MKLVFESGGKHIIKLPSRKFEGTLGSLKSITNH